MPLPRPGRALASTIDAVGGERVVRDRTARPGACKWPSTTFQPLPRRFNDLERTELTSLRRTAMASDLRPQTSDLRPRTSRPPPPALAAEVCFNPWNPGSSAPPAENGILPQSTSLRDAARAMWKTARSAASRMCFASNTTTRRRSSSSPLNWSEKADFGPQTSDLRPQTWISLRLLGVAAKTGSWPRSEV